MLNTTPSHLCEKFTSRYFNTHDTLSFEVDKPHRKRRLLPLIWALRTEEASSATGRDALPEQLERLRKDRSTLSWEDMKMKKSLVKALVLTLTLTAFGTVSTANAGKGSDKAPSVKKYRVNC